MRLNQRIKGLETHRYAPELNKLHLMDGVVLKVPGATSIKDAKYQLRWAPLESRVFATITKTYPEPWGHLNATFKGWVVDREQAMDVFRRQRNAQGGDRTLFDGTTLPVPIITVRTELRG